MPSAQNIKQGLKSDFEVNSGAWEDKQYAFETQAIHSGVRPDPVTGATVKALKKLISEENVDAIIGPSGSPNAMGVIQFVAEAGVPLLAGSDTIMPYVFPGSSLHEELALMVEAGLPPLAALKAATSDAARFMGRDDLGVVRTGALATLSKKPRMCASCHGITYSAFSVLLEKPK